jgi:hypothetical protein
MVAGRRNHLGKLVLAHVRYKFVVSPSKMARFRPIQDIKQPSNEIFSATVEWLIVDKDAVRLAYGFDGVVSFILKDISIQIIAYHVPPSW